MQSGGDRAGSLAWRESGVEDLRSEARLLTGPTSRPSRLDEPQPVAPYADGSVEHARLVDSGQGAPRRTTSVSGPAWALLFLSLALAVGSVATHPVTTWRGQADEGCYLRYATRIAEQGPGAFPALFREYLQDPLGPQYFPSPLRLTPIALGALSVLFSGANFSSLADVSLVAFLALLVLLFMGLRGTLGERTALAVTLVLSVSPLHLAMARRALADSLNATLVLTCLWLCIHGLTAGKTAPRWWAGVAIAYAVAFLGRELNLVLIPISLALIGGDVVRRRRPIPLWAICCVSLLPLLGAAALAALAAGGVGVAWAAFSATLVQPGHNAYALEYGNGPWFRYVVDYLLLSPWTTLLYLAWLGYLAGARIEDERLWAWALVPILFLACATPFAKFVRWALPLDAPLRLGAVLLLQRLVRDRAGNRWATVRLGVIIAGLMWADLRAFHDLFVVGDIYDPTSALLLAGRGFLPR